MKLMLGILIWLLILVFFPFVAIVALVLWPILWLISLPIRLVTTVVDAALNFLKAVLFLPARILSARQPA